MRTHVWILVLAACGAEPTPATPDGQTTGGSDTPAVLRDACGIPPALTGDVCDAVTRNRAASGCVASVTGRVVDFASGRPIASGVTVAIDSAFDALPAFHRGCGTLAEVTPGADGRFAVEGVPCTLVGDTPILAFYVDGAGWAPTVNDQRATCDGSRCRVDDATVYAVSVWHAAAWEASLARDGEDTALGSYLALRFRDRDGAPAAGVRPSENGGAMARYAALDDSLADTLPDGETGASGTVLRTCGSGRGLALAADAGASDALRFDPTGVATADGAIYVEEITGHE